MAFVKGHQRKRNNVITASFVNDCAKEGVDISCLDTKSYHDEDHRDTNIRVFDLWN